MLVWFHRWLGVTTCVIVAAWFASGAVLLFVPFPSLSRTAQLTLEAPLDVRSVTVPPAVAIRTVGGQASGLRLINRAGRASYVVMAQAGAVAVDARTGTLLANLSPSSASGEAKRLFGAAGTAVSPVDYDQWIVHNRFDLYRPYFRLDANDTVGTQIYLSARTGELLQRTTRSNRAWNWAGAVLHWAYVTPLRASFTAWDRCVWWVSLVCLLVVVAGIALGFIRMAAARRMRSPSLTFYRMWWLRWHHLLGLFVGVFVFGWMLSGWLSMDHGRIFSRGTATISQAMRYQGLTHQWAFTPLDPATLRSLPPAKEVAFSVVAGTAILTTYNGARAARRFDVRGRVINDCQLGRLLKVAVRRAWPGGRVSRIAAVDPLSTYAMAEGWPSTARRITFVSSSLPDIYVDAANGGILTVMDTSRAAYAWVYYGLHTFNVPGLTARPMMRRIVILIPLLAGFLFSITGVVIGWKRLRQMMRSP